MSLKIPDPNSMTDKQWDFLLNLCLDTGHLIPDREAITFSEAQELIDQYLQEKKAREKEFAEPDMPSTIDETNYFEEDRQYGTTSE